MIEPPEPVVCFQDDLLELEAQRAAREKAYPKHWGNPPLRQTRDYWKLPEPFGYGSSTLFKWIRKNQEKEV